MAPNIGTGVWRAPQACCKRKVLCSPLRHLAMLHSIRRGQCRSGLGADHLPPPISMRCLGWTRRLARTHLCCGALTGAAGVIVQHLLRERGGAIAFVGSAAPTCFGADAGRERRNRRPCQASNMSAAARRSGCGGTVSHMGLTFDSLWELNIPDHRLLAIPDTSKNSGRKIASITYCRGVAYWPLLRAKKPHKKFRSLTRQD
jgi:hypothetical protein